MKIKSSDLSDILKKCHVGAFTSAAMAGSARSYIFCEGRVCTQGGSILVSAPLAGWSGQCTVDAVALEKLLSSKKSKASDLDISLEGNLFVLVRGKSVAKLTCKTDISPLAAADKLAWQPVPAKFLEGLKACLFSNKSTYEGVAMTSCGNGASMLLSTDASRICYYPIEGELPTMWLGSEAIKGIGLAGHKCTGYCLSLPWLHLMYDDGTTYSCLCKDHSLYPFDSLMGYIKACQGAEVTVAGTLPEQLSDTIDTAAIFTDTLSNQCPVHLVLNSQEIVATAANARGSLEDHVPWGQLAEPLAISEPVAVTADATFFKSLKEAVPFSIVQAGDCRVMCLKGACNQLLSLDD